MCNLGRALKSGELQGVLYVDGTPESEAMQKLLDSVSARYECLDASAESWDEPVLVVDGAFLDFQSVKELLGSV